MWQADVQRDVQDFAQLYASWEGSGPLQVICLLDPPRHALPASSYQEAQRNVSQLFDRIPGRETFVAGLQEDFMQELRATPPALSPGYLDEGGLGIVQALKRSGPAHAAIGLESAEYLKEYKRLENQSIEFMSKAAPFLSLIAQVYSDNKKNYSPELVSFLSLVAAYRQDSSIGLNAYVDRLLEQARSLSIDLEAPRYKPLLVFESISRLEPEVGKSKAQKLSELVGPLARIISLYSQTEVIDRRAVWQLRRYQLQIAAREEDEIERIEEMLQEETLPEPAAEIIAEACKLVKERCLTDVLLVRPGEDKQELLGSQGAMIANLLELAAVLGIAPQAFPSTSSYMHYLYFNEKLKAVTHNALAKSLSDCMDHLVKEIGEHLAKNNAEQALLQMDPAIHFIEALGQYHILHGEEWKKVILGFSISEICIRLSEWEISLPFGWLEKSGDLDKEFAVVRDFFDLSVLRGKDMASSICASLTERNLTRGVLYCDSFLHDNLARWFQSHDVSYSLLFPRFSVGKERP